MLYDLAVDPVEAYKVALRQPESASRLLELIERWERDGIRNPLGWR
jgi:hypothetical protein